MRKFRWLWGMRNVKAHRRENAKFILTNCKDRFKIYITTTRNQVSEAVSRRCSVKKVFLKILQNSQKNTCVRVSFLIKLQASCNFIKKEVLAQVFSYELCKIFKNTFYIEDYQWLLFQYIYIRIIFCYFESFRCWLWACICLLGKVWNIHCCSSNLWNTLPCKQLLDVSNRNPKTRCGIC